ncbi:aspartate 1-decarboxylase, partial [Pararhizobium sp. YC-54]|uniref:aspartate 1-decarboxylase n=1 Tax=Pararhizobium sp. YC-54 TaxID=2986920 RepID=UPI0021F6C4F3
MGLFQDAEGAVHEPRADGLSRRLVDHWVPRCIELRGFGIIVPEPHHFGADTQAPVLDLRLKPLEYVDIWNKMSGARISTYVLYGDAGSRCCILNGAAARTCQQGDEIIIASSTFCEIDDIISLKPRVLVFGAENEIVDRITYEVFRRPDGSLDMAVNSEVVD